MTDPFRLEADAHSRRALYLAVALLLVIPFLQALSQPQIWPMKFGNINWRFGLANILSGIILLPFLGFLVLLVLGRAVANRGMLRAIAIISIVFAVGLVGSTILFAFDALQLKSIVPSAQVQSFNMLAIRVAITSLIFAACFVYLALTALKPPQGTSTIAKRGGVRQPDEGVGLLVGR